jgi:hypothetical protein
MTTKVMLLTIVAAMLASVAVSEARVHHRHGFHGYWHAYGYASSRSNPTNTNGFGG